MDGAGQMNPRLMKFTSLVFFLLIFCLTSGCTGWESGELPTPLPPEQLPTIIAQTIEAGRVTQRLTVAAQPSDIPSQPVDLSAAIEPTSEITSKVNLDSPLSPTLEVTESAVMTASEPISRELQTPTAVMINVSPGLTVTLGQEITASLSQAGSGFDETQTPGLVSTPTPPASAQPPALTRTPAPGTPTRRPRTPTPTPTITPIPEIPDAEVQIYKPGELSKVISPLHLSAYLSSHTGKRVTVDLLGEDGRLLVRQVRTFPSIPWRFATLGIDLNFAISAAAEAGRLVIQVDDDKGRIMALNSVNLVLMSVGEEDINPSSALQEAIIIQQPVVKALIQGGTVLVSGQARPNTDQPLLVQLVNAQGSVVGERLVAVSSHPAGGYGVFAVDVPYTVNELTPVRLVVYEPGDNRSPVLHLSSIEVLLSP